VPTPFRSKVRKPVFRARVLTSNLRREQLPVRGSDPPCREERFVVERRQSDTKPNKGDHIMAIGKEIGDFTLKSTSTSYAEEGGSVQINCDGTATGYGTVLGTLTLRGEPGAKKGPLSWRGQGFLENGETVTGAGEGNWEEIGKHKWRTRLIVTTSDGRCHASDGQLNLQSRTLSGKMLEWS
jgi:hypothetical protein